ncbi:hypothetical protein CANCADRAFT_14841, partial [Tortispora caseinolytica NRRL Y-17796]
VQQRMLAQQQAQHQAQQQRIASETPGPGSPLNAGTPGAVPVSAGSGAFTAVRTGAVEGNAQPVQAPADGPSARPNPPISKMNTIPAMNSSNRAHITPLPIPPTLNVKAPNPATMRTSRPTLTQGTASNMISTNTPALMKIPPYEAQGDRILNKRKLSELVRNVIGEEGDVNIDGDVEELLLDLADDFVTTVTSFACRLAKHRKSSSLDVKDVQLHLERNYNIRIPGYSADEIRSVRRTAATAAFNQKVSAVNNAKASAD